MAAGDVSWDTHGNLEEALGRIRRYVFSLRDAEREQRLIPDSELRTINNVCGHFGLFDAEEDYFRQVDDYLNGLLAVPVPDSIGKALAYHPLDRIVKTLYDGTQLVVRITSSFREQETS